MKRLKITVSKHNALLDRKKHIRRAYWCAAVCTAFAVLCSPAALATDDPLTAINGLSDFVFSAIQAIGVIILGWGVVQIGMGIQGHDASQRTNGIMSFFGGLMIAFAKPILDLILGS